MQNGKRIIYYPSAFVPPALLLPALQAVAVVALVGAKGSAETAYIYFSKIQKPAWRNLRPTL